MSAIFLCIHCKHHVPPSPKQPLRADRCKKFQGQPHPVHGLPQVDSDAGIMRLAACGWDTPQWWEPKDGVTGVGNAPQAQ